MSKLFLLLLFAAAATPLVVRSQNEVPTTPILGGKGKAQVVLDPAITGSQAAALDLLEAEAGAAVPTHTHDGSDEILYLLEGKVSTTVGEQTKTAKAGDTIFIPKGAAHSARFLEKTRALQVYAPAGPEQRFK